MKSNAAVGWMDEWMVVSKVGSNIASSNPQKMFFLLNSK
jgi:hypothetical protein